MNAKRNILRHPHPFAVLYTFHRASYILFWAWLCHFIQSLPVKCHNFLCLVVLHVIGIHNAILFQPCSYLVNVLYYMILKAR